MPARRPDPARPGRRRALALASLSIVGAAGTLALPARAQIDPKVLRIGVEGAYPPFSEVGADGQLKGFDIDIARALCAQLKLECALVQVASFDAMIPSLRARKFDAIVASMSITAERKKAVAFTRTYYDSSARFVGRADGTFDITPAGLKGRKIGVERTTIHDRYATAVFKDSQIVRYARQDEVFLDLVSGRIDGTLADTITLSEGFLKKPAGKGFAFRGPVFDDPAYFGDGAGIAVRQADEALRTRLDQALAALLSNGTYQAIQSKYFDFDIAPAWSKTKPK